jgi:hypothetical protein
MGFLSLELPEKAASMGKHVPLTDPNVNGVLAHVAPLGDLVDRQRAICHDVDSHLEVGDAVI